MLNFDLNRMLFTIGKDDHTVEKLTKILKEHPEVQFVSYAGLDMTGNDTDERIPMKLFLEDMEGMLKYGVQTDGSSVDLPKIATLNNAKTDMRPDFDVNWYVDYNFDNIDYSTELPVGTLRIPSYLIHNDVNEVGSRSILRDALNKFKEDLKNELTDHPYVLKSLGIKNVREIEEIVLTSATELEFWVKTPDDKADTEELSTSQELKEQYWKRTYGPVRTALEDTLKYLDMYGLGVEMGHKEVGGVKSQINAAGLQSHIMEQIEIDWKYAEPMQVADNEKLVRYVVRDIFSKHCLNTTFKAKPIEGVAGSGEHTHLGVSARLKDGTMVNLFAPKSFDEDFLSPIGFGALMGLLKNYEAINPFVSSTNDAFKRLKPGYEAPVCIVTSLGTSPSEPSRNRSILVGLIRDKRSALSTRFELRSPNPKSNTYLVIATCYMAMLDGIKAALENEKTSKDLEKSISKKLGSEDFYLEKDREYRSEANVFEAFDEEERNRRFGAAPKTVWENLENLKKYPDKLKAVTDGVFTDIEVESYEESTLERWATELHQRLIPGCLKTVAEYKKLHEYETNNYDTEKWQKIEALKNEIAKNEKNHDSLLLKTRKAIEAKDFELASNLQIEVLSKMEKLAKLYQDYKRNLF